MIIWLKKKKTKLEKFEEAKSRFIKKLFSIKKKRDKRTDREKHAHKRIYEQWGTSSEGNTGRDEERKKFLKWLITYFYKIWNGIKDWIFPKIYKKFLCLRQALALLIHFYLNELRQWHFKFDRWATSKISWCKLSKSFSKYFEIFPSRFPLPLHCSKICKNRSDLRIKEE